MSKETKIEWADSSWNPWIGCTKVSAGCKNCYAENTTRARVLRAHGQETWGKGAPRSRTSAAYWKQPYRWNESAYCDGCNRRVPRHWKEIHPGGCTLTGGVQCGHFQVVSRVFPSLCDWLDDEVPAEWLADFIEVMMRTPNLDWLLLTKRPENFHSRLRTALDSIGTRLTGDVMVRRPEIMSWLRIFQNHVVPGFPPNIWIGASAENQEMADKRIPELLKIPAKVRFLSLEPLLGPISLDAHSGMSDGMGLIWDWTGRPVHIPHCDYTAIGREPPDGPRIHWVIAGGESGPGARPCNVDWIREIVRDCQAVQMPVFVKQLGGHPCMGREDSQIIRHPKGGDMGEWPLDLQVREFPIAK